MAIPGFTGGACLGPSMISSVHPHRGRDRRARALRDTVRPQEECSSYTCSNGLPATGIAPDCECPPPVDPPPEPTCETEITCPSGLVAFGNLPNCGCKSPDAPTPAPGGGGGVGVFDIPFYPGSGGIRVCNDMLVCPDRWVMALDEVSGACICK